MCVRAHLVRERGYLMWLIDTVCTPTCAAIFLCFSGFTANSNMKA